jgi:hypothetical protein
MKSKITASTRAPASAAFRGRIALFAVEQVSDLPWVSGELTQQLSARIGRCGGDEEASRIVVENDRHTCACLSLRFTLFDDLEIVARDGFVGAPLNRS